MRYSPVFSMILSFDFWSNYACFIAFIFSIYIFFGGGNRSVFFKKSKRDLPKRAGNFGKVGTDNYMT